MFRRAALAVLGIFLAACASVPLAPGVTTEDEVRQRFGEPAMRWTLPDGSRQLAYPSGPFGTRTDMVFLTADGLLIRRVNVLDETHFARIRPGMTQEEVQQLIGPPQPQWEAYFARRDELAWEWRYCMHGMRPARFHVLFDGTTRRVRSTMSLQELRQEWPFPPWPGHRHDYWPTGC